MDVAEGGSRNFYLFGIYTCTYVFLFLDTRVYATVLHWVRLFIALQDTRYLFATRYR